MKKGFTLAEVLITLGVIGVVAALTVPNVMQSHQKKVWVTQLQKAYNQVANAAANYLSENEISKLNDSGYFDVNDFMGKYFSVTGYCKKDTVTNCLAGSYKTLNNSTESSIGDMLSPFNNVTCGKMGSGSVICISDMMTGSPDFSSVIVDVNGTASPNVKGRDYFQFELFADGKVGNYHNILANASYSGSWSAGDDCGTLKSYQDTCISKLMNNGWKMNY